MVARLLNHIGGKMPERLVMLPVVFLGIFEFAWVGFWIFATIRGSAHAADLGFQGHVLILPSHHGLLSIECGIVKGVVGE